ncbi:MAG: SRPBCC family protein [Bryobacteraceae bacterium]|jgi:ribosome-associated toxin RatA of RatAB toxin-antitoxin module
MRHVEVIARVAGRPAGELFLLLCDMRQFPNYSGQVLALEIAPSENGSMVSTWTVKLGPGTATWTQQDDPDPDTNTIRFRGISGDIDYFSGAWTVRENDAGSVLTFACDFDIGLPGFGNLIEPRIANLLSENIRAIFSGMFGVDAIQQE